MRMTTTRLWIALGFAASSAPALADDCATLKSAMLHSGHTPHTVTVTKTAGQKQVVTRQVQTVDNKYVQLPDGKWYAMNIAMKDLNDNTSSLLTCRRSGMDIVGGESTAVYEIHLDMDGQVSDQKWWVSSKNLVLKTDGIVAGTHYTTEYDFAHVAPPANAISMGGK